MKIVSLAFVRGFVAILLFGVSNYVFSQFAWIKEFNGKDYASANGLSIDKDDNLYLSVAFSDDFQIEDKTFEGKGVLILKLNADGELMQHILITSTDDYVGVHEIKTDGDGNVYATGVYGTSFKINNQVVNGSGFGFGFGSFIIKFDSNLNLIWNKVFDSLQFIGHFSVNKNGQMLIYSPFSNGNPVSPTGNAFAVLYDSDGTVLWSKIFSTNQSTVPISTALDDFGNSYFTGYYSGPFTIDSKSIPKDGNRDIFLAKMDQSGNCVLLKNFRREADPLIASVFSGEYGTISVDDDQNIYIASSYWTLINLGSFTFNGDPLYSRIFVAKLDIQGNVLWASADYDFQYSGNDTAMKFFSKSGKMYLSGTIGKKGFFAILNDPQISLVSPVYLPFEFVDNAFGGLALDSQGNIYGNGRFSTDIYSGFLYKYTIVDPMIIKGYPIVANKSYCRENNEIFLQTEFLPNATEYKWEITWNGKIIVINTSTAEILINPSEHGINDDFSIRVRGKNQIGEGSYSDSKDIILDYLDISALRIPNIITPNNDSFNQYFILDETLENPSISIYNRWGKQVYQKSNYDDTWSGEGLANGTYYYTIQSKCTTEPIKGWITVKR